MGYEHWFRRFATTGPESLPEYLLFVLLVPFSWGVGLLAAVRHKAFQSGVFRVFRAPVPVISVGNLAVGGTGKTPTVSWLLHFFVERNARVAVVSRGYGGTVGSGVGVVSDGRGTFPLLSPYVCGDEPYLLARKHPHVVVLVSRRRREGVDLAVRKFGVDVVILDDGFQHHAVARDLDIVLLDARMPFGNGLPLPAGLLREFPSALQRGNLFLLTRSEAQAPALPYLPGPLLSSRHRLSRMVCSLSGEMVDSAALAGRKVVAFAGIAEPAVFFSGLLALNLNLVETLPFPDHCAYGTGDLKRIADAATGADILVTTEKDGVKLAEKMLPLPCFQVPLELEIERPDPLVDALCALLRKEY